MRTIFFLKKCSVGITQKQNVENSHYLYVTHCLDLMLIPIKISKMATDVWVIQKVLETNNQMGHS